MRGAEEKLKALIKAKGGQVDVAGTEVEDGALLLAALSFCESDFGRNNRPRVEKNYLPGGYYFNKAWHVRQAYKKYGAAAAASYGPWQILYITAFELGFRGKPADLTHPEVSLPWVIELLNDRILAWEGVTLEDAADAYNSGSFEDLHIPAVYIRKLVTAYHFKAREWLYGKEGVVAVQDAVG